MILDLMTIPASAIPNRATAVQTVSRIAAIPTVLPVLPGHRVPLVQEAPLVRRVFPVQEARLAHRGLRE